MAAPRILVLDRSEDLALQVKRALGAAWAGREGPEPEIVPCTQVAAVATQLEDDGPYAVLLAGPVAATWTGLAQIDLIRQAFPLTSVVLAFDQRPEARLRDVIRTGAVDLLELPVDDDEILEAIERAVTLHEAAMAAAPLPEPVIQLVQQPFPVADQPAPSGKGRIYAVASATGGCGKTFMATNLAYFLHTHGGGARVCLVDLDLQFGEVSTALRMRPRHTIFDALEREEDETDFLQEHIEEYLSVHETGFHVLAAPRDPIEAERVHPADVVRIVEAVSQRFDHVVVDTPAQLSEIVTVALDLCEQLFVITTLDLPSVRNMSVFLSTLERLRIPTHSIQLILNKAESDVGIDISQVEKLFPQGFKAVLPYSKEVSRSINLGTPVMAASPHAEVSRQMDAAMVDLLPIELRTAGTRATGQPKKRHMFGRK
ncbi:MAG: AAA family ATPase [Acidimicrobiales bacterium]